MKNNVIRLPLIVLILSCAFSSSYLFAGSSEVNRLKAENFLAKSGLYNRFSSSDASKKYPIMADDCLDNADESLFSALTGESFTSDPALELEQGENDFWNYEIGNSENYSYQIKFVDNSILLRNIKKSFSDGKLKKQVSEADVLKFAARDLVKIGLTAPTSDLDIQVHRLSRTTMYENGKTFDETVAFKVFVYRKIAGLKVRNSRIILSYYMDGDFQKLSMKWPTVDEQIFVFPAIDEKQKQHIATKFSEILNSNPKGSDRENGLLFDMELLIENGKLVPVVIVKTAPSAQSGLATDDLAAQPNEEFEIKLQDTTGE